MMATRIEEESNQPSPDLIPYEELTLSLEADRLRLFAPWTAIDCRLGDVPTDLLPVVDAINSRALDPLTVPKVSAFLRQFQNEPIAYALPRRGTIPAPIRPALGFGRSDSPIRLLQLLGAAAKRGVTDELWIWLANWDFEEWSWDCGSALAFAKQNASDAFDPLSLFTVIRREQLKDSLSSGLEARLRSELQDLAWRDDTAFRSLAALCLRQYHYAATKWHDCIRPALRISEEADIVGYVESSVGCDRYYAKALTDLGYKPAEVPVVAATKWLLRLVEWTSRHNFLAFAAIIDQFERASRIEALLTSLFEGRGLLQASRALDLKARIKAEESSDRVALAGLEKWTAIDTAYARDGFRIAEAANRLLREVESALLARITKPS